jgi:hypothetical protein
MDMSTTGKRIIPEVPSWIRISSEDDPIYKKGFVFGGTYSSNSSKNTPETASEIKKEPMSIEELYEEAAIKQMKETSARMQREKQEK